ncbi:MAG: cupin domain-containing protein [Proteobacteria bacterium]|nr:cupin domain-containing protein [Pseudomonadota bacterium]
MVSRSEVQILNIENRKQFSPKARVNQGLMFSTKLESRMNCYEPGQITPMHQHPDEDELLYIVEGGGKFAFKDGEDLPVAVGDLICLPAGLEHRIEAVAENRMVLIYVIQSDYRTVSSGTLPDRHQLPREEA